MNNWNITLLSNFKLLKSFVDIHIIDDILLKKKKKSWENKLKEILNEKKNIKEEEILSWKRKKIGSIEDDQNY